jgi:hypothetical protein
VDVNRALFVLLGYKVPEVRLTESRGCPQVAYPIRWKPGVTCSASQAGAGRMDGLAWAGSTQPSRATCPDNGPSKAPIIGLSKTRALALARARARNK